MIITMTNRIIISPRPALLASLAVSTVPSDNDSSVHDGISEHASPPFSLSVPGDYGASVLACAPPFPSGLFTSNFSLSERPDRGTGADKTDPARATVILVGSWTRCRARRGLWSLPARSAWCYSGHRSAIFRRDHLERQRALKRLSSARRSWFSPPASAAARLCVYRVCVVATPCVVQRPRCNTARSLTRGRARARTDRGNPPAIARSSHRPPARPTDVVSRSARSRK